MAESDGTIDEYRRSSFCGGGNCVEVRLILGAGAVIRHGGADGLPFSFSREEWVAFIDGVKAGEFDPI